MEGLCLQFDESNGCLLQPSLGMSAQLSITADAVNHVVDMLLAAVRQPRAARDVEAVQVAASQQQHAGVRDSMAVHDV